MWGLLRLILKSFKILLRSRTSALIILFGPLLLILLMGFAFDNVNPFTIKIGVHSNSSNDLSNPLIEMMERENISTQNFTVLDECIERIKDNDIHACIVMPQSLEVKRNEKIVIQYYVDSSNLILVDSISKLVNRFVSTQSTSESMDKAMNLLKTLDLTKETIDAQNAQLTALTQDNNKLKSDLDTLITEVRTIDTSFSPDETGINEVREEANRINVKGKTIIKETRSLVDYVGDDLGAFNLSSGDEDDLLDELNATLKAANNFERELNATSGEPLLTLISQLSGGLSDVANQFKNIENVKSNAVSNIGGIQDNVDTVSTKIITIQTKLKELKADVEAIPVTDADVISQPIVAEVKPIAASETYLKKMMPTIIILVAMLIGLLLATTLVMMEKKSPSHFRNYIVPIRDITFIISTYITCLLILLVQMAVILCISYFVFGINFSGWGNVILALFLSSTVFIFIGMFIGYIFKSDETAILASIAVGILSIFLSNILIPIESMSQTFQNIVKTTNPLLLGTELLRKSIVYETESQSKIIYLIMILIYVLVFFLLTYLSHKLMRKNYFQRFLIKRAIRQRKREKKDAKFKKKADKKRAKQDAKRQKKDLKKQNRASKKESKKDSKSSDARKHDGRTKEAKKHHAEKAMDEYEHSKKGFFSRMFSKKKKKK